MLTFVDDVAACGFTCGLCQAATTPQATTLAQVRTLAAAFMHRHLNNDAAMEAWLTGASVPAGVTARHRP